MTRTLYEINKDFENAIEFGYDPETGEILADIEALAMERDEKIRNCACYVKNEKALAEALKAEKRALDARIKEHERKAAHCENYMADVLGGQKVETTEFVVSFRKSQSVELKDLTEVPPQYLRYKDPELDKMAVKQALKQGADVPGVELIERLSMTIK